MDILRGNLFIRNDEIINGAYFNPHMMQASKSIYEVLRVISGIPLFLEEHLERLKQSAAKTNHELMLSPQEISERIRRLINACQIKMGNIKVVVDYLADGTDASAIFYGFFIAHHYPSDEDYATGIDTITYRAERSNPNAKVANIKLNATVNQAIEQSKVYEALLLNRNGNLTEGSRSNLFMIKDNTIFTAPLNNVLPGITRGCIMEICDRLDLKVIEKNINENQLADMDALFLTGTSPNVLAIRRVNQLNFNSAAHPVVRIIMREYDLLIKNYLANHQD